MLARQRILVLAGVTAGTLLLAVGVTYLTVACENLPGLLGPTAGDTSPRSALGVAVVVLGVLGFVVAAVVARRRPPKSPDRF